MYTHKKKFYVKGDWVKSQLEWLNAEKGQFNESNLLLVFWEGGGGKTTPHNCYSNSYIRGLIN